MSKQVFAILLLLLLVAVIACLVSVLIGVIQTAPEY